MNPFSRLVLFGSLALLLSNYFPIAQGQPGDAGTQSKPTSEQLEFFEKHIRPVLVKECYACHAKTAKRIRGGLTLDTQQGMRKGGDTGPAVVPGSPRRSLLLKAIRHVDDDLKMPPSKKLSSGVISHFEKWISMGAPDPRSGVAKKVTKREIDIEKGRKFWSFRPVKGSKPPEVKKKKWPKTEIDHYLLAALEAKGLEPVGDIEPRLLFRRLTLDLIGLLPEPKEVEHFVKAQAINPKAALESAIDRLLQSPRYGERWARHWLDVARYGESSGRAANIAYPHAWRYRDYVIAAFNADKPYDRFIREQISGDLLPAKDPKEKAGNVVATGFLAIGPKSHNERSRRQFQMDLIDEQIDVTFQAFQGLTVACARCHDHKFDPIPQKDYYALAGIFRSTETCYGTIRIIQSNHPSALITLPKDAKPPVPLSRLSTYRRESIERQIKDQTERMSNVTGSNAFIQRIFIRSRIETLRSQLALYDSEGEPKPLAMGARESRFPSDSRLYHRGEQDQPGDYVLRGFPQVITDIQPLIFEGSGRLELGEWLSSKKNPLTARVMANRVWLHLMGQGLVPTPDNFGASGLPPSHPELLDYLALSLMDNNWSIKKLIRAIVLSRAYHLSSQHSDKNFEADPDNVLHWRMPKRRVEAEVVRDMMLQMGGRLDLTPPVGSDMARRGEGSANSFGRFRGRRDPVENDTHRTIYLPIVRDQLPEVLTLFDFPDPSLIIGERATTTVPAQSLYLLNNPFVIRQAEGMADKILSHSGTDEERIKMAYLLCYSREPSGPELKKAGEFLKSYLRRSARRTTWGMFCQALLASVELSHH